MKAMFFFVDRCIIIFVTSFYCGNQRVNEDHFIHTESVISQCENHRWKPGLTCSIESLLITPPPPSLAAFNFLPCDATSRILKSRIFEAMKQSGYGLNNVKLFLINQFL